MEPLVIQLTDETPEVNFNPAENVFSLKGVSLPEDVKTFYAPVLEWTREYVKRPNDKTRIEINLTYFNTASSKMLHDMLMIFNSLAEQGKQVEMLWHYYDEDEDMEETGEMYQLDVSFPIIMRPYSD